MKIKVEIEYRVFGPPGTGKTTYLVRLIQQQAQKYGSENIMVASFSKTAAAELAGRNTGLEKKQVGTLHSHCFRLHGGGMGIAEKNCDEWNKLYPSYTLGKNSNSIDDAIEQAYDTEGDRLLSQLNVMRGKLAALEDYPNDVLDFRNKWIAYKLDNGYMDFCDLIEKTYESEIAPEYTMGFFDEAQDFTPLELALIRKWKKYMKCIVLAGDDDQCIYSFKGCTPKAFMGCEIPAKNKKILTQSYRVPRVVQQYASRYIQKVQLRETKNYLPKDIEGKVRRFNGMHKDAVIVLDDAQKYLKQGKTVMFLTSCSYMLEDIKNELKRRAMPFHNPYRRTRGDWNPLSGGSGTSAAERLMAFHKPVWTNHDVYLWGSILKSKTAVLYGAKKMIRKLKDEDKVPFEMHRLSWIFTQDAVEAIQRRDVGWMLKHTLTERKKAMQYPARLYKQYGKDKLSERPQVVIGTIHSVKGGEADVVYLFPDISLRAAKEQALSYDKQDEMTRLFYVGMTRAKETLILCNASGKYGMEL